MAAAEHGPGAVPSPAVAARLRARLLEWYRGAARDLPWRRTTDPYAIWISEVMLQQTQVATVVPYYERFMARFPTVEALAAAEEHDALRLWAGLGYYSRARALLRGAREVAARHGGQLPRTAAGLQALPGIGPYTASAIASLAFGEPEPVVDGNVTRVFCRLFALRGDPTKAPLRRYLWELGRRLLPPEAPGDFNSAVMELGAVICRPLRPECERCPVAADCQARAQGLQEALPETPPRPVVQPLSMAAAVVRREGRLLMTRRGHGHRWAGLWQFPNVEVAPGETPPDALRRHARDCLGVELAPGSPAATLTHSVTRYRVTLRAFHCRLEAGEPRAAAPAGHCAECAWVSQADLDRLALPAAHRRLARVVEGGRG